MRRRLTRGSFGCWLLAVAPLCAQSPILPPAGNNPVLPISTLSGGNLVGSGGTPARVRLAAAT